MTQPLNPVGGRRMGYYESTAREPEDELDYLRPSAVSGPLLLRLTRAATAQDPNCKGRGDEFVDYEVAPTAEQAAALCAGCPIFDECREYAQAAQPYGVWGGEVYE